MRIKIGLIAFLFFVMGFQINAEAVEVPREVVELTRHYVDRLKAGEVREAVDEAWDVDALLESTFGLTYLELPETQRARSREAFTRFAQSTFANIKILRLIATVEIVRLRAKVIDDRTIIIRFVLNGDEGRFKSVNSLLWKNTDRGWRIVDARNANSLSIRVGLASAYMEFFTGPGDTLPDTLERAAVKLQEMMSRR